MNKKIFKSGVQSKGDPFKFVMSSDSVDRMGDIVEQDWRLSNFRQNPISLWNHDSSHPIGVWQNVKVKNGRLEGDLHLAEGGTSPLIDTLRSLVRQRVLKTVSVGFRPGKVTPLEEGASVWEGARLSQNELLECSLVSVPANAEAIAIAKSHKLSFLERNALFQAVESDGERKTRFGAFVPQTAQASAGSAPEISNRGSKMNLSERIQGAKEHLDETKDALATVIKASTEDEREISDDESIQVDELTLQIDSQTKQLEQLERAEQSLVASMKRVHPEGAPAIVTAHPKMQKGMFFKSVHSIVRGHIEQKSPTQVVQERYNGDEGIAAVVKAAVDPARTDVESWAEELVRESYSEFMDLLLANTVYPNVPGMRHNFGSSGRIVMPGRTADKRLNGSFVAEGAPIPVRAASFTSQTMTPRYMAVITTMTSQIIRQSNPAIEGILRQAILDDTGEVLDTTFLDDTARDSVRPAGLQNIAGLNTHASGGVTVDDVLTDLQTAMVALSDVNLGNSGVWVMNPAHKLRLSNMMLANGNFMFRDELNGGSLQGFPVLTSNNVTAGLVYLVDSSALTFASEYGPTFDVSNQTSLHMEDTTPVDIMKNMTPADPVKSMFQTDSVAIRMTMGLDWAAYRAGGVYVITGVSW